MRAGPHTFPTHFENSGAKPSEVWGDLSRRSAADGPVRRALRAVAERRDEVLEKEPGLVQERGTAGPLLCTITEQDLP